MTELIMQRYFTETLNYIRQQGARSLDLRTESCVYLASDGNKCAIGYWIPDGHPAQEFRGSVMGLHSSHSDLTGIAWPVGGLALAHKLQSLHDEPVYRTEGKLNMKGEERAAEIAKVFGLEYTPPVS